MFFRARRDVTSLPRLEAGLNTNGQFTLTLHGRPGTDHVIESRTSLSPTTPWQSAWHGTLSNAQQQIPIAVTTNRTMFFRAIGQ